MTRRILTLALLLAAPAFARAQEANDDAKNLARKLLDKGAETFAAKDAPGMAATYAEDAELTLIIKGNNETKVEIKRGRAEIEGAYKELFKDKGTIKPKNTVEFARFVDPEILIITGVFEPDTSDSNAGKLPFVQIREKRGDQWLMTSLRIWAVPNK